MEQFIITRIGDINSISRHVEAHAFKFAVNLNARNDADACRFTQARRLGDAANVVVIGNRQRLHAVFLRHADDFLRCVVRVSADDRMDMIIQGTHKIPPLTSR